MVSRRSRWRPKNSRPYVRTCITRLLENCSLLFSETLQLVRACKCEKNVPIAFLKKFPFCPFWPKIVQNWPLGWMCARVSLRADKVGVFETDFKQFPFVLRQTTHTYSESWGPVEKMTQKPKIVSKIFFPNFCLKNLVSLLKIDFY